LLIHPLFLLRRLFAFSSKSCAARSCCHSEFNNPTPRLPVSCTLSYLIPPFTSLTLTRLSESKTRVESERQSESQWRSDLDRPGRQSATELEEAHCSSALTRSRSNKPTSSSLTTHRRLAPATHQHRTPRTCQPGAVRQHARSRRDIIAWATPDAASHLRRATRVRHDTRFRQQIRPQQLARSALLCTARLHLALQSTPPAIDGQLHPCFISENVRPPHFCCCCAV